MKIRINKKKLIKCLIVFITIYAVGFIIYKIYNSSLNKDNFHIVSTKVKSGSMNKNDALMLAYDNIAEANLKNELLSPTNLNLNNVYGTVIDDEERKIDSNQPMPVTLDEFKEKEIEEKSQAFQIFEKLQSRYAFLRQTLINLSDTDPVSIVRQYGYNGYSIIGKYNPEDKSHVKGKRHTYFIKHFDNVNIKYFDGDGNEIFEDNNIKDIMSMASVYTYYHNPYDSRLFLRYCYDLFDRSYAFVASVSEVYYCSGCVHTDDPDLINSAEPISLDKVSTDHMEQIVIQKEKQDKAGTLMRMKDDSYVVKEGSYNEYVSNIFEGNKVSDKNYCPGHIDLNIFVKVLTLNSSNGLPSIDKTYGGKGLNYTKDWHGWDNLMLGRAREMSYKDWEAEYGLSISYVNFVKPLTVEEINYYLNRLDSNITPNRRNVIEVALRSVGKVPYYYGGKTSRAGYETNAFGSKVKPDYKGRVLKGLDCSGWINWVYQTAFNKRMIGSEGTAKLVSEGSIITRKELLPGDIVIRPGYDSHVMMFLEWAENGKMKVIHENGSVNNVSIATFDAYYPYYRRIINS